MWRQSFKYVIHAYCCNVIQSFVTKDLKLFHIDIFVIFAVQVTDLLSRQIQIPQLFWIATRGEPTSVQSLQNPKPVIVAEEKACPLYPPQKKLSVMFGIVFNASSLHIHPHYKM